MRGHLVTLFLLYITSSNVVTGQDCPWSWSSPHASWPCYLVTNRIQRSWQDARTFCVGMGGDLIKIDSVDEMNWVSGVLSYYQKRYSTHIEWWIGLSDNPDQTSQSWVDKSAPTQSFLPWIAGEPGQYDHSKSCVELYNNTLRHQSCSSHQYFICERSRTSVVWCDTRSGWEAINGKCYKITKKLLSWNDSRAECTRQTSDLMLVEDEKMQTVLYNFLESRMTDIWIGLKAVPAQYEYAFKWVGLSNRNIDRLQSHWTPEITTTNNALQIVVSSNGSQACVIANHTYAMQTNWQMGNCDVRAFSICQKPQGRCASGWIQNGEMCYQVVARQNMKWASADVYCSKEKANLLTIKRASTQQFISGMLPNLHSQGINVIWLGLSDSAVGQWTWSDNVPFDSSQGETYSNLGGGSLTDTPSQLDCVNIFTDDVNGTWQMASNCNANYSFICEIRVDVEPTIQTTSTVAPYTGVMTTAQAWSSECGPFWVLDSVSGYCFKFSDSALSWFDARASCQSEGGDLASVANFQEEKFIADRLFNYQSPALWIGLNSLVSHRGFHWVDGTAFAYINWAPGEPNNVNNLEHCGEFIVEGPKNGKWNDINCSKQRGYVCKKRGTDAPTTLRPTLPQFQPGHIPGCPNAEWYMYKDACFYVGTASLSWQDSRLFCQTLNSELATISNENEQNFLYSILPLVTNVRDQFWIGLNDRGLQMKFQWVDNSTVTYTNWAENEPNNWASRPEDCVVMLVNSQQSGEWNDAPCESPQQGFICKTPMASVPSDTQQMHVNKGCNVIGSRAYGYKCFGIKETPTSFASANVLCAPGHLAEISNSYQQAFLASQIAYTGRQLWIGLSQRPPNNSLRWTTDSHVSYTAWRSDHTGNELDTCYAMDATAPGVGLWVTKTCGGQLGYICEYPRPGYTPRVTTPTTTLSSASCADGWLEYSSYCYKGSTAKKNWLEARADCQSMGAELVSFHSQPEEAFAMSYGLTAATSIWIGLNDFNVEKGYLWTDGTSVDYTNWGTGEPNDSDGSDDCVEYNSHSMNWNDNFCYIAKAYVCKIKKGVPLVTVLPTIQPTQPSECGDDPTWVLFNDWCYYVSQPKNEPSARKSWHDARSYCKQNGADLVSIHSHFENDFVVTLLTRDVNSNSWIGLNDIGVDQFAWSDGTQLNFEAWSGGEPNDAFGSEKCTQIQSFNGHWNDNNCNEEYHFMCKRMKGGVVPQTVAPTVASTGGCPQGFSASSNSNKCYTVYGGRVPGGRKNFTDAMAACRAFGTGYDLASINSVQEMATVVSILQVSMQDSSAVWIGMNDLNNNRRFNWLDNQRLLFTSWGKGQPSATGGKCVEMYTDSRHAGKWYNTACANVRAYVCEAQKDTKYTASTLGACKLSPDLTDYFENPNTLDCYKVNVRPMTWSNAKGTCEADHTLLASINSVYDQAFINTVVASGVSAWIGLGDIQQTGTYQWEDHFPVTFTNWGKGQPTYGPGDGCVATNNGYWNDTSCNNKYLSICKKNAFPAVNPTRGSGGYCGNITWSQFGTNCYYLELRPFYTWASAESNCQSMGMELSSIQSKFEENFMLQLIDNNEQASTSVWIGLKRLGGYFSWTDQKSVSYINWATAPVNGSCVYMQDTDGRWRDTACDDMRGYICKTAKLPPTSRPSRRSTKATAQPIRSSVKPGRSTERPVHTSTRRPTQPPHNTKRSTNSNVKTTGRPAITTKQRQSQTVTIPNASDLRKQKQQPHSAPDLSGGQITGIVIGVLLALVVVASLLIFLKRRHGNNLFIFKRFGNGAAGGFSNASYDRDGDSIHISASSRSSKSPRTSNGQSISFDDNGYDD